MPVYSFGIIEDKLERLSALNEVVFVNKKVVLPFQMLVSVEIILKQMRFLLA